MRNLIFYIILLATHITYAQDPFALPQKPQIKNLTIRIHYTKAATIAKYIRSKNSGLLSNEGHIITDENNNQLWLEDDIKHLEKIKRFIQSIDLPIRQVLIKARIILIDDNASKQLGIFFSMLDDSSHSSAIGLNVPLIKIANQKLLDIKLMALSVTGHAVIISTPKLITNNRQSAVIESGDEIPYQEKSAQGNTSITFKKAVLRLKVIPIILPFNKILLKLNINQDKPSGILVHGVPTIITEKLQTHVVVANQQTLILGGIREQSTSHHQNSIPWINRLPIIGLLFKNKQLQHKHKQLLIFITPSIVK